MTEFLVQVMKLKKISKYPCRHPVSDRPCLSDELPNSFCRAAQASWGNLSDSLKALWRTSRLTWAASTKHERNETRHSNDVSARTLIPKTADANAEQTEGIAETTQRWQRFPHSALVHRLPNAFPAIALRFPLLQLTEIKMASLLLPSWGH